MTKDEYKTKLDAINNEHDINLRKLDYSYAMQFKKAAVGDIIVCSSNERVLRVESIKLSRGPRGTPPDIVYCGELLKKRTLKPYKKPVESRIYGAYFGKILVKNGGSDDE